jgi:hypothetical protein
MPPRDKAALTLGFPCLINSMSLNVITFACHVLDQQLMLPGCAEFMLSFLASSDAAQGLGTARDVSNGKINQSVPLHTTVIGM